MWMGSHVELIKVEELELNNVNDILESSWANQDFWSSEENYKVFEFSKAFEVLG